MVRGAGLRSFAESARDSSAEHGEELVFADALDADVLVHGARDLGAALGDVADVLNANEVERRGGPAEAGAVRGESVQKTGRGAVGCLAAVAEDACG